MFKTKLFAAICTGTSFVVAATTALTLAVSGPRNTQSLHMLSDNNAVAYGFTNLLGETTSAFDTISNIVDTVSDEKASISGSFTINSIEDMEELSGMGAGLEINFDTENGAMSLIGNASYGSMDILKATLYLDKDEMIAEIPALFKGIIIAPLDNLEEDFSNSYFGELAAEDGFDYNEFRQELEAALDTAVNNMPQFDFDYEEFYDGLLDTISDSYYKATDNMTVKDLGKKPLQSGEKYQCYRAELPVADLSYIVRDAVLYILNSDEFASYIEQVMEYMSETSLYYDDDDIYGSSTEFRSQLKSSAKMIEMYWGQVVTELEGTLGKEIVFTIYLDNAVNPAGFEFYVSEMEDGTISFEKNDVDTSEYSCIISADLTGGNNIGDYADYNIQLKSQYEDSMFHLSKRMEPNGDFNISATFTEDENTAEISLSGAYTDDDPFFTCNVDSFKVTEDGNTLFDVGFTLSFQPIDKVEKPSGSPEYNIWEMDENDFNALTKEIQKAIEEISSLIE